MLRASALRERLRGGRALAPALVHERPELLELGRGGDLADRREVEGLGEHGARDLCGLDHAAAIRVVV
jgi:hypothetical protein